ncbi:hypothetical protein ADK51_13915, partial [Streptomyces sp. WM6368]
TGSLALASSLTACGGSSPADSGGGEKAVTGYSADGDPGVDLAIAAMGAPEAGLADALARAAARLPALARTPGYHPFGLPDLRSAVADRFTRRGLPTRPEQILVTAGAQQAFALIVSLLCRPGDRVVTENPTSRSPSWRWSGWR